MSSKALKLLLEEKENKFCGDNLSEQEDDILDSRKTQDNLFKMLSIEEHDIDSSLKDFLVDKPKKKKNKKRNKQTATMLPVDDNILLDQYIQHNNLIEESKEIENGMSRKRSLLQVDYRFFDPENELKKYFGSIAVERDKRKYILSKRLIKPKKGWASFVKSGLSMRVIEKNDFQTNFVFEHANSYREIQFKFLNAVESFDPQAIMNLHKEHPSHIDTMLQLCDMCCIHDNWEMATELIDRCLYIFEQSFHSSFNCTLRNNLLPYKYKENRSFFVTLFRHMTFLGRRGCCRTALEFSKLILNLDKQDPLAILLVIDFYALRCGEYDFLIGVSDEWREKKNLHLLPNFALSLALAHFKINSLETSDQLLQKALILFPSFLPLLLEKCSIKADDAVSKHTFLTTRPYNDPESLKMIIRLYVHRNYICWKDSLVVAWLERNVKQVLQRVDAGEPLVLSAEIENKKRFGTPPLNICRHIILAGIKEATVTLPPALTGTTILSFDPLPPADSISSYIRPQRPATDRINSWISLFFESILPSFDAQRAAENRNAVRADRGNFMEILRDLQANIQFVPPPQDNQPNDDEEHAEEHLEWND